MHKRRMAAAWLTLCCTALSLAADDLEQGFVNPPASAKPWAYFFVMDGNQVEQ